MHPSDHPNSDMSIDEVRNAGFPACTLRFCHKNRCNKKIQQKLPTALWYASIWNETIWNNLHFIRQQLLREKISKIISRLPIYIYSYGYMYIYIYICFLLKPKTLQHVSWLKKIKSRIVWPRRWLVWDASVLKISADLECRGVETKKVNIAGGGGRKESVEDKTTSLNHPIKNNSH